MEADRAQGRQRQCGWARLVLPSGLAGRSRPLLCSRVPHACLPSTLDPRPSDSDPPSFPWAVTARCSAAGRSNLFCT